MGKTRRDYLSWKLRTRAEKKAKENLKCFFFALLWYSKLGIKLVTELLAAEAMHFITSKYGKKKNHKPQNGRGFKPTASECKIHRPVH